MLYPSLEKVRELMETNHMVSVHWEIPADHWSPLQIYAALSRNAESAFLLEHINTPQSWKPYSYIGIGSPLALHMPAEDTYRYVTPSGKSELFHTDVQNAVADVCRMCQSPYYPDYPEFSGGLVCAPCGEGLYYAYQLFEEIVAYDHLRSHAVIIVNIHKGSDIAAQYQAAEIRAAEIAAQIEAFRLSPQYRDDAPPIVPTEEEHSIHVLNPPDSLELYRRMRSRYAGPNLFCMKNGTEQLVGVAGTEMSGEDSGNDRLRMQCFSGANDAFAPEVMIRYMDGFARIQCRHPRYAAEILELMRSAKHENTSINQ